MIDPQDWPPLCGAVAGCGLLLILSGAAKLVRTVRGTGLGTAVQKALHLSDTSWRVFQPLAGTAEFTTGLLVGMGVRPAVTSALMACQGLVFVFLLTHAIRNRVPGDCGCLARRRPNSPQGNGITRWAVARAAFIALAGGAGAAVRGRPPSALPSPDDVLAWTLALAIAALLAAVDLGWRTPRCRRSFLFPARTTLAEVTGHHVYRAMVASLGPLGDAVSFRRAGCIDEFWFPAQGSEEKDRCYLEIKAGRTTSGVLALTAAITEQPPSGSVRTLPIRH